MGKRDVTAVAEPKVKKADKKAAKELKAKDQADKKSKTPKDESESEDEAEGEEENDSALTSAPESENEGAKAGSNSESSCSDSDSSDGENTEESESKKRQAEDEAEEGSNKAIKVNQGDSPATNGAAKSEPTNIFVGQLSWNVDDEWLASVFSEVGTVKSARVQTDRESHRSRGFGYVEFELAADARKAVETMQGHDVDGRAIRVDFATQHAPRDPNQPREQRGNRRPASDPSGTLFVGGLAWSAEEGDLRDAFGEHGSVTNVRLPTDINSGKPKGFAYVEFGSIDEAKAALAALNGADIKGRPIRLDYASPRDRDGGNGGGRGGFGRRGRGGGRGGFGGRGGTRGGRGGFRESDNGWGRRSGAAVPTGGKKMTFDN